jgi:hypothetical protein
VLTMVSRSLKVIKAPSIPSGSSLETTQATDWSSVCEVEEQEESSGRLIGRDSVQVRSNSSVDPSYSPDSMFRSQYAHAPRAYSNHGLVAFRNHQPVDPHVNVDVQCYSEDRQLCFVNKIHAGTTIALRP